MARTLLELRLPPGISELGHRDPWASRNPNSDDGDTFCTSAGYAIVINIGSLSYLSRVIAQLRCVPCGVVR